MTTTSSSASVTQQQTIPIHLPPTARLILRSEPAEERHIQWAEDVVDNEGMGKKSSKVCCIYHGPHTVDESSDSDDSSSSSSSSDESDGGDNNDRTRPVGVGGGARRSRAHRKHSHGHDHEHNHDHDHGEKGGAGDRNGKAKRKRKTRRKASPNAYERMPKYAPASTNQTQER